MRKAVDLRVRSLSNCGQKIIASALVAPLTSLAAETVHENQCGGIRGRFLADCLLKSDASAIATACVHDVDSGWLFTRIMGASPWKCTNVKSVSEDAPDGVRAPGIC